METKRDTLTQDEIRSAASALGVEPAALAAVAEVESSDRGAFDADGYPTILYERHVFHRLTEGRFDGLTLGLGSGRFVPGQQLLSSPINGGWRPPTPPERRRVDGEER